MATFEINDVLPDTTSVSLPRRQYARSSQELAVTLVADYTLRHRAWLPSAAIVALLTEAGTTAGGARTTISRLARRGVLENSRQGRTSLYRLSQPAANVLAIGAWAIAALAARAESWDGYWTLIAFSVPSAGDTHRRALRTRLRALGYAPLYDALWVSPYNIPPEAAGELADKNPGAMTVFRADHVALDAAVGRNPLDAWDLTSVAQQYEAFAQRWGPLLPRIRSGEIDGAEALGIRTEVMNSYRRFIALDPCLPTRLMPPGWGRHRAREVFVAAYDGLAQPALRHLLDTVSRFTDAPHPGIGTHSVADLLAPIAPSACPTATTPAAPQPNSAVTRRQHGDPSTAR